MRNQAIIGLIVVFLLRQDRVRYKPVGLTRRYTPVSRDSEGDRSVPQHSLLPLRRASRRVIPASVQTRSMSAVQRRYPRMQDVHTL